jgi:hypothetical protein
MRFAKNPLKSGEKRRGSLTRLPGEYLDRYKAYLKNRQQTPRQ